MGLSFDVILWATICCDANELPYLNSLTLISATITVTALAAGIAIIASTAILITF
jgi:hypothetical protein